MRKGYFEIRELSRPLRDDIGSAMEYSLSIIEGFSFLHQIENYLDDGFSTRVASRVADQRLLDYTRKVIQLTEEKIAFESKKTVDNAVKVA